jgi:hypothetical protein
MMNHGFLSTVGKKRFSPPRLISERKKRKEQKRKGTDKKGKGREWKGGKWKALDRKDCDGYLLTK